MTKIKISTEANVTGSERRLVGLLFCVRITAKLSSLSLNTDLWLWSQEERLLQMFVFTQVNSLTDVYIYIKEQAGIKSMIRALER